ncbi:heparinase II/III family protein [Kribbella sp. NPDC059898]|uniref:heparinase II/III domain-containing protein n=1 Tax=Kribbella sp. NPDC059898 TaxID=3346995 RepID=UPI0036547245
MRPTTTDPAADRRPDSERFSAGLSGLLPTADLARALAAAGRWQPYPDTSRRSAWTAVDQDFVKHILAEVDHERNTPWPELTASGYLRFSVDGDRQSYETPYLERRDRLARTVLAAALATAPADRARHLSSAIDGIWLLCEESSWCFPAHEPGPLPDRQAPTLDLFAAETGALLAYAGSVLGPVLRTQYPLVADRIDHEVRARVLRPYRDATGTFWYAAGNNWNPWIHSNVLAAALLVESGSEDLIATIGQVLRGLDHYLAQVPADGGCDEGITYWWRAGATLFECLEILHTATGGAFDAFDLPLLGRIARYPVAAHIGGPWHVNFADGFALPRPGTVVPGLLHRFGRAVGDPEVVAHAGALAGVFGRYPVPVTPGASLACILGVLFDPDWAVTAAYDFPYPDQTWLPTTEVLVARERPGADTGLFLAAKAGHNAENHNHNDVGNWIVAHDGVPVIIDVGVGNYTARTFSGDRYEIWTMRSSYHNVPTVDGFEQAHGADHRAAEVAATLDRGSAELRLDLGPAYPSAAGIRSWSRTMRLQRDGAEPRIVVEDQWDLEHDPDQLSLHLMTATAPRCDTPGVLTIGPLLARFDVTRFEARIETVDLTDDLLTRVWGSAVHRVTLTARAPGRTGTHRLLISAAEPSQQSPRSTPPTARREQ